MRIVFLGTSHGYPEPGRRCSCVMIRIADRTYFVDMGTQIVPDLVNRGIPVESVKGVFITHMHGDHTNGLISFADLVHWHYKTADPLILMPEQQGVDALENWIKAAQSGFREGVRIRAYEEGVIYDDKVLKVTAIRTKHLAVSYAFLIEAQGKRLLFTGDLNRQMSDFPVSVLEEPLDLLVCESAHFSPLLYKPVLQGKDIRQVIITHYAPRHLTDIRQLIAEMEPMPVKMANDGLELEIFAGK